MNLQAVKEGKSIICNRQDKITVHTKEVDVLSTNYLVASTKLAEFIVFSTTKIVL